MSEQKQSALRLLLPAIPQGADWHMNRYDTDDTMVLLIWRANGSLDGETYQFDCAKQPTEELGGLASHRIHALETALSACVMELGWLMQQVKAREGGSVYRAYQQARAALAASRGREPEPEIRTATPPEESARLYMTGGKDRPLTDEEVDAMLAVAPPTDKAQLDRIRGKFEELKKKADSIERGREPERT